MHYFRWFFSFFRRNEWAWILKHCYMSVSALVVTVKQAQGKSLFSAFPIHPKPLPTTPTPAASVLCWAVLSRFSPVQLFLILWTCQAPLSMGLSRQEYWSGLPCPPPGDLPGPGTEPTSPALAGRFFSTSDPLGTPWSLHLSWSDIVFFFRMEVVIFFFF